MKQNVPKIEKSFLNAFKIHLPCAPNCYLNEVEHASVFVTNTDRFPIIQINFTTYIQDTITSVFEANPFDLYGQNNTHICKVKYTGPKYVLVNTTDY